MRRTLLVCVFAATALMALPPASAKDIHPGDVRVCNAKRCVAIMKPAVLSALDRFYYGTNQLTTKARPALGTPYFQLRFRNGYVTGIVGPRRLDRFLSYGVNVGRFSRGQWYVLPRGVPIELRRLTAHLKPLPLTRAALAKAR